MTNERVRVLFVCLGNICRSPSAQGVFQELLRKEGWDQRVEVDSAGTTAYHAGQAPDPRAQEAAAARGIDLSAQRARRVTSEDFSRFDYVLAMDSENLHDLQEMHTGEGQCHLGLFLEFSEGQGMDVPDPYYGGGQGFEVVLDILEEGGQAFFRHLVTRHD